jgi:hypothetical protein
VKRTLLPLLAWTILLLPVGGFESVRGSSGVKKSVSGWVTCGGASDDTQGVARAFQAARHNAFTLIVDCPVRLRVGIDIDKTIFIDDGTTVEFTGAGKFTVDNVFHPAFVMANSGNITLTNWNVEYDASLPVDWNTGGYERGGQSVAREGYAQPAGAFNDRRITPWLTANRGITFDWKEGHAASIWVGPTNTSSVFFITGDTFNVRVTGLRLYVPAAAGGDRFIPMAFSLSANYKSNQIVTVKTPRTAQFMAIPHDLTFSNIELDGTYMGWQGNARNVLFEHIQSHRYGDLQDAKGRNVGGIGKWFAPPHLFYLNYPPDGDSALFNQNIRISDVVDDGPRVGAARDKGGTDRTSGYALSLKIGCVECSVDTYKTNRPDGFLDVLPSAGLTISNVDATYDSSFLNNLFPGWRFPSSSYKRLTFENIAFRDLADSSVQMPIGSSNQVSNENIVFKNVNVRINRWSGKGLPLPNIMGQGTDVSLDYSFIADASRLVSLQKGAALLTLQAAPATLSGGGTTALTWTSKQANSCSASGAWSGTLDNSGSRVVKLSNSGNYDFTFNCQTAVSSSAVTLRVVVE